MPLDGHSSFHYLGNSGHIEPARTRERVADDDKRELPTIRQRIDGSISFLTGQTVEFRFLEANSSAHHFVYLCLQDLEAPLERELSSRTFRIPGQSGLKSVAAIGPAASSAAFVDDLYDDLIHSRASFCQGLVQDRVEQIADRHDADGVHAEVDGDELGLEHFAQDDRLWQREAHDRHHEGE